MLPTDKPDRDPALIDRDRMEVDLWLEQHPITKLPPAWVMAPIDAYKGYKLPIKRFRNA